VGPAKQAQRTEQPPDKMKSSLAELDAQERSHLREAQFFVRQDVSFKTEMHSIHL